MANEKEDTAKLMRENMLIAAEVSKKINALLATESLLTIAQAFGILCAYGVHASNEGFFHVVTTTKDWSLEIYNQNMRDTKRQNGDTSSH